MKDFGGCCSRGGVFFERDPHAEGEKLQWGLAGRLLDFSKETKNIRKKKKKKGEKWQC